MYPQILMVRDLHILLMGYTVLGVKPRSERNRTRRETALGHRARKTPR